jgi:DNA-binding response OmpR family regulator
MLLTVADTAEELEKLRVIFSKSHYFTYCSTTDKLLSAAKRYKPHVILIETNNITDTLRENATKVRDLLPYTYFITISNEDTSSLLPVLTYPQGVYSGTVLSQIVICVPRHPCASDPRENMIVHGLHMDLRERTVSLYGLPLAVTHNEAFLLRYLCEIYPRRADATELAKLCFGFGVKAKRSTVASRISRINAKAAALLGGRSIITCITDKGYQIDF